MIRLRDDPEAQWVLARFPINQISQPGPSVANVQPR